MNWEDPIYDQFEDFGEAAEDYPEDDRNGDDSGGQQSGSDESNDDTAVNNKKAARQQTPPLENGRSGASAAGDSGASVASFGGGSGSAGGRHAKSDQATKCDTKRCQLPACRCGSSALPSGLLRNNTPQLITLTFDDAVNDLSKRYTSFGAKSCRNHSRGTGRKKWKKTVVRQGETSVKRQ